MKLPQLVEELIRASVLDHLDNVTSTLRAIERKLQVLGSELAPYFHELHTKIDELSERIEHHEFSDQDNDNEPDSQDPSSSSAE